MDSYKNLPGAEGCSSSESGWTMYIASPIKEDDAECSNNDEADDDHKEHVTNHNYVKKDDDGGDDDSDDSMASDASSGPRHFHGEGSNGTSRFKQDKSDKLNKCSSRKNANKQEKKRGENSTRKK